MTRALTLALATGAVTVLGVGALKLLIGGVEWLTHGWYGGGFADLPWPLVVAVPTLGGLAVGLALHVGDHREGEDHGVTEVLESATLDVEEFPDRNVPLHAVLAGVSLGSGASLGPEDPSVEIGAGVGEWLGRWSGVSHEDVRGLVAAGAAGGISALILAPLAAVAFAVEVFAVRVVSRTFLLVAVASAAAYGGMVAFHPGRPMDLPPVELPLAVGLVACVVLGALAGLLSAFDVRFTYWIRRRFVRWEAPVWLKPAAGGVALGLAGLLLPQLLGIGYETTEGALGPERPGVALLVALLAGKVVLVAVSFGSGFRGGFFAPAFFVGALLGAIYGEGAAAALPDLPVSDGAFGVVGMAAVLAGFVHAPVAAALTLATLAGDPGSLPFLLVGALVSHWTARAVEPGSLYTHPLLVAGRPAPGRERGRGDFSNPRDLR